MRVHLVLPAGFDDPARPSGGNVYDRRVAAGLAESGWDVRITVIADDRVGLADAVAAVPDGETVLVDGLLASPAAVQLLPHARRLCLVVLLHMPLATAYGGRDPAALRSEREVLGAAAGVVVPSEWTRQQVLVRLPIAADRVRVARPGVDRIEVAPPSGAGGHLLCVAAVAPHKGQDVLLDALAEIVELDWDCVLVGPLDRDRDFVDRLRAGIRRPGLAERIRLAGVRTGVALRQAYLGADLLVAPSRSETYGMVVTEALALGRPVFAAEVGGVPEALGFAADGTRPGTLVPPGDSGALAAELTRWLGDASYRQRLRAATARRRSTLPGWEETVRELATALVSWGG